MKRLPHLERILALPTWDQICTVSELQPFLSELFHTEHPVAQMKIMIILLASEPCLNIHQWGPIGLHVASCNLVPIEWKVFVLLRLQYFFYRYNASRMLQVSYKEFVRIIQRRRKSVLPTLPIFDKLPSCKVYSSVGNTENL